MTSPDQTSSNRRREITDRLEHLLARAASARGLSALSDDELLEFGRLYRRAAAELSHARSHGFDPRELERLNALAGRAYGILYVSRSSGLKGAARFLSTDLPSTLRRQAPMIGLSAALMLLGAILGLALGIFLPETLELVAPEIADAIDMIAERHEGGADWLPEDFRPIASSLIMINNIQVSFFAFSTGILLGIGTIYVLIFNGFLLGAIAAGVTPTPAGVHFWAFVAPHGVIELPAIVISGGAGLLLGLALVDPGEHSRLDSLRLAGRQAGIMMLGVILFLAVAGVIEGLFSPSLAPPALKFAAAALFAVGLAAYILLPGQADAEQSTGTELPGAHRD
jgi:uncharacterized membrane protein SpoIIM required for sporulation